MKDYDFGNTICELRKTENLSQSKLASLLGISNKAVSKWENGNAKPSLEQIVNLSKIFNVSIDELLSESKKKQKNIYKIVITGGPCSGKSTALSWLQTEFTKKGYLVIFVPESASELIIGGVTPYSMVNNLAFETAILKLQLYKESLYEEAARNTKNYDKILIVCDRGCLDTKAYSSPNEFRQMLKSVNMSEVQLRDSYDAVFHLVRRQKVQKNFTLLTIIRRAEKLLTKQ